MPAPEVKRLSTCFLRWGNLLRYFSIFGSAGALLSIVAVCVTLKVSVQYLRTWYNQEPKADGEMEQGMWNMEQHVGMEGGGEERRDTLYSMKWPCHDDNVISDRASRDESLVALSKSPPWIVMLKVQREQRRGQFRIRYRQTKVLYK